MYLTVLLPLPPMKKIRGKRRCLCLGDKTEAVCYDQTLASQQGEEGWGVKHAAKASSFRHSAGIQHKHTLTITDVRRSFGGLSHT